jgi:hypothetical protein
MGASSSQTLNCMCTGIIHCSWRVRLDSGYFSEESSNVLMSWMWDIREREESRILLINYDYPQKHFCHLTMLGKEWVKKGER